MVEAISNEEKMMKQILPLISWGAAGGHLLCELQGAASGPAEASSSILFYAFHKEWTVLWTAMALLVTNQFLFELTVPHDDTGWDYFFWC